jgi:peptidoglycan hydrolase CwlO-like protein
MPYYVIGDDKGFEEAYSADEVDAQITSVNTQITSANNKITTLQNNLNTTNTNVNAKQKKITSGTAAPSGGSNGDIYIQY